MARLFLFLLAFLCPLQAVDLQDMHVEDSCILSGAHVLAPSGDRWLEGEEVWIEKGRIRAVGPDAGKEALEGTTRIDLGGGYLLPGLIDLHTHLLLHPYDEATWNDQVLRESLGERTIRAVRSARRTLEAGFTTIRDLGTEGAAFADVDLRDAVASGLMVGPRILASTRAIVATGCYGPSGFDPRWQVPRGAQEADGVVGMRRAVREQIAAGADWIKLYADYRRRSGYGAAPTFTLEEMSAAVDEARSARVPVAAHATTDEAIQRAVDAGVVTIEHGSEASAEMLAFMRDRGVTLVPTLAASEAMARYAGWSPGTPEPERIRASRAMFRRALDSGVAIGCGGDTGVFSHGGNAREIELMVAYGMQPAAALRAATSVAAEVLGLGEELGAIRPGARADLLVVGGDPLEDVRSLRLPQLVLQAGAVVYQRAR